MLEGVGKAEILSGLLEDLQRFLFSVYTYIYESSQPREDRSLIDHLINISECQD